MSGLQTNKANDRTEFLFEVQWWTWLLMTLVDDSLRYGGERWWNILCMVEATLKHTYVLTALFPGLPR